MIVINLINFLINKIFKMKNPLTLIPYFILTFFLIPLKKIFGQVDESMYSNLEWNFVGPYRGGRSTTVSGVISKPYTFFMGTTGGGVWKTTDAGNSWKNISDGQAASWNTRVRKIPR